jgi:AraC-like DNA-binding protein
MRQPPMFDRRGPSSAKVLTLSYEYRSGRVVPEHFHEQDQLLHALRGVTAAALTAGYSTPSSFISMFRRAMGTTPGEYFRTKTG